MRRRAESSITSRQRAGSGGSVRFAAVPHVIKEIGPIFGFISFPIFVGLVVVYVIRALEIRRLRRAMPFLSNGNGQPNGRQR
jgi:hypothetical protein